MGHLPSLPDDTHLIKDVWPTFYKGVPELLAYIDVTMNGPSDVPIAVREMVFTYISTLNECPFCWNAHAAFAEQYGATEESVEKLRDPETPVTDPSLVPIFALAKKLTLDAHTTSKADVDAILARGWSEQAVADIISVIGISNQMTRIVAGMGVAPQQEFFDSMRQDFRKKPIDERLASDKASQGKPKYVNFVKAPKVARVA